MASKIFILTLCVNSALILAVQAREIDNNPNDAEFRRIFHRTRDEVPNYKTVTLGTSRNDRSKRELRPVEFEIDGSKVQLNLNPIKENVLNYVPVWTVKSDRDSRTGHSYRKLSQKETQIDGTLYEDPEKMSTLLAYYKDQFIYYDGIYGESTMAKIVRSVPEKWWRSSETNIGDDHVVFDVNVANNDSTQMLERSHRLEKLEEPLDVMYPKLLIVITNDYFKKMGEDVSETLKYISIFWNAVNLKYQKLSSIKVKILITGIIIAMDDTALRFVYDARKTEDMDSLNYLELLSKQSNYFRTQFNEYVDFKNYDAIISMTSLSTGPIKGSAYKGDICDESYNVGFINDDSSYSGLQSATHELGHLLNLPHDEIDSTKDCNAYPDDKTSTIMAPYAARVEKYIWSTCSERILREFASMKAAECMRYPSRSR